MTNLGFLDSFGQGASFRVSRRSNVRTSLCGMIFSFVALGLTLPYAANKWQDLSERKATSISIDSAFNYFDDPYRRLVVGDDSND